MCYNNRNLKYEDVEVSPLPNHKYLVKKSFEWSYTTIPAGYKTNGADIPRIFWSIIPPNDSNILPAVIVHDFLCDGKEYDEADRYFFEILRHFKINKIKTYTLYFSVRFYSIFLRKLVRKIKGEPY